MHAMGENISENDENDSDPMGFGVDPWATVYLPDAPEIQGTQIGRYKQIRKLGEGQFGIVWLGFDEQLQRPVAIKISKASRDEKSMSPSSQPNELELKEARNVALLDHPNIVPVYDVGITKEEQFYVVSKFIEGETLQSTLAQRRWSVNESVRFVQTIAEALAHAHERGLVHRDIKPANILIDRQNGRGHVTDFGLAFRRLNSPASEGLVGTPNYMSPEQVRFCTDAVDARSDIFSLGVILYEMLAQRRPFHGETMAEPRGTATTSGSTSRAAPCPIPTCTVSAWRGSSMADVVIGRTWCVTTSSIDIGRLLRSSPTGSGTPRPGVGASIRAPTGGGGGTRARAPGETSRLGAGV